MTHRSSSQPALSPQHLELGRFLIARRGRVTPAQVGLPHAGIRRTPGLRREEVALLAGVSVSWYTWIEQGRAENVSGEVLDSIARTLLMEDSQRVYLRRLAGIQADYRVPESVPDLAELRPFVENWSDSPAYVADRQWNLLIANDGAREILGVEEDDNLLWELFTSARTAELYPDWESDAQDAVARFRSQTASQTGHPRMASLVRQLCDASDHFTGLWELHEVAEDAGGAVRLTHRKAGLLHFTRTTLDFTDRIALRLTVFHPVERTGTRDAVRRLLQDAKHRRPAPLHNVA